MGDVDERKQALRAQMKALREGLGASARAAADEAICAHVVASPQFEEAPVMLAYLSFGAEVATRGIIRAAWDAGKQVALPYCVPGTRQMRWFSVDSLEGLVRSRFGVDEPAPDPARELHPAQLPPSALCLVPGLTFDDAGFRLGYGGGFYDALLAGFPGVTMGLCRAAQRSRDLREAGVIDAHDLPVQLVVTD